MQFWAPQFRKVLKGLGCIQKSSKKLVRGIEGMPYKEGAAEDFGLVQIGGKKAEWLLPAS